jgi:transposase-like protein
MRQAREIIRLKFSAGLPTREIARRLGVAASTVRGALRRFEGSGQGWPLPNGMSAGDLEAIRQSWDQTGPSPARRAGLADGSSGAEAQARHPGDRLG